MPLISRKQLFALTLFGLALACSEGPSGVSAGNLSISISGLPSGTSADLVVTGPGGYSQGVTGAQVLSDLAPGTYTLTANPVTVGSSIYIGTPETQDVSVSGSTASLSVLYSAGTGNLSVTITGLGTRSDAAVTITGPGSYSRSIGASETLFSLTPGTYTISAQDVVATGGTPHTATSATQSVTVSGSGTDSATVSYAPPSSGELNLRIAGLYVTQSAQTFANGVPLVQDRNGYLRVFAVATRTNTAAPAVRVRVYNSSSVLASEVLIPPPGLSVPTAVDESSLSRSWNTPMSGTLIQPGFRIEAEIDPTGTVPESDETDNLATPPAPVVQTVPTLNLTFVPVIQKQHALRGDVGNVTIGNRDEYVALARKMHPIAVYNTAVHAPYTTTTTDTLQDDNGNSAWGTILEEIDALRVAEGSSRYYYGVAKVSYTSGVAGVAYVSNGASERSALGWDYLPSGAAVAAHELGHNWGRNHAPCGGPSGVDNGYPHADGRIGVYGVDVAEQSLKPASTSDIMGYCDPKWIGDYTYKAVMNYLISPPPIVSADGAGLGAVQPCLLVWGHIRNGVMVLEPSFHVNTRPTLPSRPGPYSLEATTEGGGRLFSFSFSPREVADAPGDHKSFVFAVPVASAQAARLTSLRLAGPIGQVARTRTQSLSGGAVRDVPQLRLVSAGRVGVQWDARTHPMAMVRDVQTGEVLSFARGGYAELVSQTREVDVVLSDGIRSSVRRVPVAR
ncbi:MAG TPA: zinc-dependent metalloprotease family protein [Gemmatimonadales bacterium]|nr:zinc-dependent metalloprotease family protein [Gemmatimonadales bacterium]